MQERRSEVQPLKYLILITRHRFGEVDRFDRSVDGLDKLRGAADLECVTV